LAISNSLVLNSGAVLQYALGTTSDQTVVRGNLTLDGTINITDAGGFTNGLDLGDRSHYVCVLDAQGRIIHEGPMLNERVALALLLTQHPRSTVALEAGTHSPWISRYLTGLGATVIVAICVIM